MVMCRTLLQTAYNTTKGNKQQGKWRVEKAREQGGNVVCCWSVIWLHNETTSTLPKAALRFRDAP